MIDSVYKFLKRIVRYLNSGAQALIAIVMVLMVINILGRAIFNHPIAGIYDIVTLLYIILISFSIAFCAAEDGHVHVDFFVDKLPGKVQTVITTVMSVISFVFFILVSYQLVRYSFVSKLQNKATMTTGTPHFPFFYVIALGMFLMAVIIMLKQVHDIKKEGTEE